MKRLSFLLLLPLLLLAQPEFFGYFESEGDLIKLGNKQYGFGYHKFRLDVESRPNDNILIGANLTAQTYWGQSSWNLYDFLPKYSDLGYELMIQIPDTLLLDNVYMTLYLPFADLTLGRQQVSPGVGYAWNPTDIFNSKSLLDPSYEQTGVTGLRANIPLPINLNFNTFLQPGESWETTTKQVWLKTNLGRFDLEITAAEDQWAYWSVFDPSIPPVDRTLTGIGLVGEIAGAGTWFEGAQYEMEGFDSVGPFKHDWQEWLIGVDYTFENSLYILAEYFHNELGVESTEAVQIFDYLQAFEGVTHSLMQDYSFLFIQHPTFDYVSLSMLTIANLNDHSGTLAPQIDWNAFEDTNISLQLGLGWGAEDSEFGLQDRGLRLRVRTDF